METAVAGTTAYHAKYFANELTKRCPSNSLEKLSSILVDAQVDLNPHQVDAALFAFRSPLSKGAILADEVGLGKTIEAGILLSQKWAERKRKLLIIVPSNLRPQWTQELMDKFYLPSHILETKSFNQAVKSGNKNPFVSDAIVICSLHFARSKESYIQSVPWDLVIIDEAHRLRNVYKPTNKIGNAIKNALANVPKVLLTATPLQNSLLELFGLVSIVDDHTFGDLKSFRSQFLRLNNGGDNFEDLKERLKLISKRTLRRQVLEYVKYTNRVAHTEEFFPTAEEQKLYDVVSEYLQSPKLNALPSSQRQLMTLILRKLLASSTYAIAGTLHALIKKLEGEAGDDAQDSLETDIRSDLEAFDEMLEEWQQAEEEESEVTPESPNAQTDKKPNDITKEVNLLKSFHALATSIEKNSKGEVLLTALNKGLALTKERGGKEKALIFTESRRTQEYLKKILERTEFKGKIVLFNGSNNDDTSKAIYKNWLDRYKGTDRITGSRTADLRTALVEYFKDEATIMIATEAAAEGVNLQFCSLVVNYDLPWNPQRIEQRIGRCHRYGQKHDVVVVNFLNKRNAADLRVYQLLDEKFKLFSGVFGASDEVLGAIGSGVDFEKRIAQIYQNCRTEKEIQDSFDALQNELESQRSETMTQTRQKLLENFDEEVHDKLRINLRESKEYLSKYEHWLWELTKHFLEPYADIDSAGSSFMLKRNPFPDEKIHPGPYRLGKNVEDANTYRIGHPLAQRIIEKCKSQKLDDSELLFHYQGLPKISILEPLLGKSGWLTATTMTIRSMETEDHVILSGVTDDGKPLDSEQCMRLFSLSASPSNEHPTIQDSLMKASKDHLTSQANEILENISQRNANYFEIEIEKLDRWGEDQRNTLKLSLKELDDEIKALRREARLASNLPEKLKKEKELRSLENKRDLSWKEYDQAATAINQNKDKLIDEIEKKLKQELAQEKLFTIRWKLTDAASLKQAKSNPKKTVMVKTK